MERRAPQVIWFPVPEARKRDMAARLPKYAEEILSIRGNCTMTPMRPEQVAAMQDHELILGCFVWKHEARGHDFWSKIYEEIKNDTNKRN